MKTLQVKTQDLPLVGFPVTVEMTVYAHSAEEAKALAAECCNRGTNVLHMQKVVKFARGRGFGMEHITVADPFKF